MHVNIKAYCGRVNTKAYMCVACRSRKICICMHACMYVVLYVCMYVCMHVYFLLIYLAINLFSYLRSRNSVIWLFMFSGVYIYI